MLKVFGCPTYYQISKGKLEPKAKKGVFMGYGDGVKGFQIWSPLERKIILSRDVIFDELTTLPSKSEEDLGKAKDVIKHVEFERCTINNFSDKK